MLDQLSHDKINLNHIGDFTTLTTDPIQFVLVL